MLRRPLLLLAVLASLAGCDQLGIESATATAARVEADGKAVGAACRHGGRAIEDCFNLNKRVDKAAIYAGWREMDDYMRENKIDAVAATLSPDGRSKGDKAADAGDGAAADADAPPAKSAKADKPAAKPAKATEKVVDKTADRSSEKTASADADKPGAH